jgi:hypothetical protein
MKKTKRFALHIALISALLLTVATTIQAASAQPPNGYDPRFDINGDGVLDIRDVTLLSTVIQANYGAAVQATPQPSATPSPTLSPTVQPSATPAGSIIFRGVTAGTTISGVVNIEAVVEGVTPASVVFGLNGASTDTRTERAAPFFYFGDFQGAPFGWNTAQHPNGSYSLSASAYDAEGRQITPPSTILFFVNNAATPTAVPATTEPTQTPVATPDHSHTALNKCGVPIDQWWTATEPNGCQNGSERGDAPPTWVKNYESSRGRTFSMHGPNLTSYAEANQKFMVMKGYSFTAPVVRPRNVNVDIYCVIHGGSVPFERATKAHSWRCWFRESDNGNISAIQGWYRAPGFAFERIPGFDGTPNRNNFPIIFAPSRASAAAGGGGCEQWYVGAPGREPNIEFGITFCGVVAYLKPGETVNDYDVSKWDLSGSKGTTRRLEISYYKTTRADNQRTGIYWATQAGAPVSGPNDPACKGSTMIDGVSYATICLEQNVSPTLPEISFSSTSGRNAFQRDYPSAGVVAPN